MRGNRLAEAVWALFRMVVGLLFALHGASTVFGVFGATVVAGMRRRWAAGPDGMPV
jgi:putative oxidoreductase